MVGAASSIVYQIKVSLRGISPMIWRRLLVSDDLTLYGLHRVIQIAFGWKDYHLHAFKLHGRRYGTMWTGERHRDANGHEITLADLRLRLRQCILYEYDFGDMWEHEPGKVYPVCTDGARAGPPEDIEGVMRRSLTGCALVMSTGCYSARMMAATRTILKTMMTILWAPSSPIASAAMR